MVKRQKLYKLYKVKVSICKKIGEDSVAMTEYLPKVGEKCYYMNREVMVIGVLDCFHLVKIKDLVDACSFCVDKCVLTKEPNITNSISLRLFGGNGK